MQVDVFQATLQKTGEWLRDIREVLDWDTDQRAYVALRAVLQTLRDRLPVRSISDRNCRCWSAAFITRAGHPWISR